MAVARVVSFEGVGKDRMAEMEKQIREDPRPNDIPATEIVVLHDADSEKSLVLLFFENDDDFQRAHETLDAMPASDTPGQRSSVQKYDVVTRMSG